MITINCNKTPLTSVSGVLFYRNYSYRRAFIGFNSEAL